MAATQRTIRSTEPVSESRTRGITENLRKTGCRVAPIILGDDENEDNDGDGVDDDDDVDGFNGESFSASENGIDLAEMNNNMNKNAAKPRQRVKPDASENRQLSIAYYDASASNLAFNSTVSDSNLGELDESSPQGDMTSETLIMAYDKEGNEVWVPKTMLEELGPSATILERKEVGVVKRGCLSLDGVGKCRIYFMLLIQIIVNIAGAVGIVLAVLFYKHT